MAYEAYPKWLYHKTLEPRLVQNQGGQTRLGPEWHESPADAAKAEPVVKDEAVPPAHPTPERIMPMAPPAIQHYPLLSRYYSESGEEVYARVKHLDDVDALEAMRNMEEQRPGGARKTVLRRIGEKIARLKGHAHAKAVDDDVDGSEDTEGN